MPLSAIEQELYDFARESLPRWFWSVPRAEEDIISMVKILAEARLEADAQLARTYILETAGIWLDQHAADRGLRRQEGETDAALAERVRTVEDAVTRPTLMQAVQAILDADGVVGDPAMVELRRDGAYFGTYSDRTGTGGTFATVSGNTRTFTPDVAFDIPLEVDFARSGAQGNPRVIFAGAASGGNNGTFEVTDLSGGALVYTNASGVDGADAGAGWTLRHYDVDGNPRSPGRRRAYFGRGYRMRRLGVAMVVILPYGTAQGTADSVLDMLRVKKAAGVRAYVERRTSP